MRHANGRTLRGALLSLCITGFLCGCRESKEQVEVPRITIAAAESVENAAAALVNAFANITPQDTPIVTKAVPDKDIPTVLEEGAFSAAIQWQDPSPGDWSALLGWTGICFAVHPENPLEDISSEQALGIYTGEIGQWMDTGGGDGEIHVFAYEAENPLEVLFEGLFLEGSRLNTGAVIVPTGEAMAAEISTDPQAVGFLLMDHQVSGIRMLSVDSVEAEYASLVSGKYPFRIPIYMTAREPVPAEILSFAGWTQSVSGQSVLMRLSAGE